MYPDGAALYAVGARLSPVIVNADGTAQPAVLESVHGARQTDASRESRRQVCPRLRERTELRHEAEDEALHSVQVTRHAGSRYLAMRTGQLLLEPEPERRRRWKAPEI